MTVLLIRVYFEENGFYFGESPIGDMELRVHDLTQHVELGMQSLLCRFNIECVLLASVLSTLIDQCIVNPH